MCVLALLLQWVARVWVESGVSALAHHVCGVGANHIKGLAKCRDVHCLQCVRWGGYPVLTPCFCPYPLQSPELTLSQKIKAKLQNPDLLELCHLVPKEVVQLGEAWGGQDGRWSLL